MPTQFLSKADLYEGEFSCTLRSSGCEVDTGTHYHDFYEIQLYLTDGGKLRMGSETYDLTHGDVAFINMFERHKIQYPEGVEYQRFCLSISPGFLMNAGTESIRLYSMFYRLKGERPVYHMKCGEFREIQRFVAAYAGCRELPGKIVRQKAYLLLILASLYEQFGREGQISSREEDAFEKIAVLIRFITDHISEDLSLERLAAQVGISTFYLCRLFKQYTGNTIIQYVIKKRIDIAKALLESEVPITDIALMTGFNNYSYFYKAFHKMVGLSPAEYRDRMAKDTQSGPDDQRQLGE